jgi:hypothetical protein
MLRKGLVRGLVLAVSAVWLVAFAGCEASSDDGSEALEIAGSYIDGWEYGHEITDAVWTIAGMGIFHVSKFDNAGNWLVAHNDADNEYSADLWSRFDWTTFDGVLYFCQTAFGAESEADAIATVAADPANPTETGCSGFPWTTLTPAT